MRVLVFAPQFSEYSLRYASALAGLADVKLIVSEKLHSQTEGLDIAVPEKLNVEIVPLDTNRGKYLHAVSVAASVARFRPDFIHIQEVSHPICAFLVQAFGGRSRIALTVHDPLPHSGKDSEIPPFRRWCLARVRSAADLVVVHGHSCRAMFEAAHPGLSARIVESRHGGVLVPAQAQRREAIAGRILFFGRMEAYKGLDTLTDAAEILHRRGVKFSLHLAGMGSELERLHPRLVQIPEIVLEARYLPPGDAVAALQAASLVVLPYRDATQSGVVAAAFANGRPVIASRVGGIPDVVEDGRDGILLPPGDAGKLAETLQDLLSSPDRLTMLAQGARRAAAEKLDWEAIAHEMHAEYAHSLASKRHRPRTLQSARDRRGGNTFHES